MDGKGEMAESLHEASLLTHPLIKEGSVEIREYQRNIVSRALKGNTLVVLPTGLGKTVIAAMLTAERLLQHAQGKVVVLAPTKPLVIQHAETFRKILKLPEDSVKTCTGEATPEEREGMWRGAKVIIATPQVVRNDLVTGRVDVSDWVLLVFDEAHRAVGDYPYVFIAKEYLKHAKNPLILGLTASPGSQREKVVEVCKALSIKWVEARTEKSPDVAPYVKRVRVEWVNVELPPEMLRAKAKLEEAIERLLNILRDAGYIQRRKRWTRRELLELQEFLMRKEGKDERDYECLAAVSGAIRLAHAYEIFETQGIGALKRYFEGLNERARLKGGRGLKRILKDPLIVSLEEEVAAMNVQGMTHPKLTVLVNTVKGQLSSKPESRVIVFTQFRSTVDDVLKVLRECGISADKIIGQGSRGGAPGLTQRQQAEVLERFRRGEFSVLVATSVAEEGIDVSECDLVVFYDVTPSAVRFVQRKGRTGRRRPGRVVFLIAKGTMDEKYYWSVKWKEGNMRGVIRELEKGGKVEDGGEINQQVTLEEYISRGDRLTVYADVREGGSSVVQELAKLGVEVVLTKLNVGDYVVSERVGIERKTSADFVQSIMDQRIFKQLADLTRTYEAPLLIIEGERLYERGGINPESIRGALVSVALDFKTPIFWTRNAKETAEVIKTIARREREEGRRGIRIGVKKPGTVKELQERLVASLPGVDHVLARRLLQKFKSVEKVFTANEDELMSIQGIGEKKAKRIREVLQAEYSEEDLS
ncbi:MAG: DEAD/DEAH box helicase [Candidatus Freyarchaeota archaeon]|nr:DEAD/DEAH box helicase [Candidatus Jordarchaeia archaeon]